MPSIHRGWFPATPFCSSVRPDLTPLCALARRSNLLRVPMCKGATGVTKKKLPPVPREVARKYAVQRRGGEGNYQELLPQEDYEEEPAGKHELEPAGNAKARTAAEKEPAGSPPSKPPSTPPWNCAWRNPPPPRGPGGGAASATNTHPPKATPRAWQAFCSPSGHPQRSRSRRSKPRPCRHGSSLRGHSTTVATRSAPRRLDG